METSYAERIVRALVVALMNGKIYFSAHQRVIEASEEAAISLDGHFEEESLFQITIREGLLIFHGKPLYDLSIYAHQLIKTIRGHAGWGVRITPGVSGEEITSFIEFLLTPKRGSVHEANEKLLRQNVRHITIDEKPIMDNLDKRPKLNNKESVSSADRQICRKVYTEALSVLQDIMIGLHHKKQVSFNSACDMAEKLTTSLDENRDSYIALTAAKDYDSYTFNHSVNVCIYAATMAESLTTHTDTVVRIAQAALLHDVGKLLIPEKILNKKGIYSDEERKIMNQHTVLGAKILIESEGSHDMAVNVAFGHHLRFDRKGYPEVPSDIVVDPVVDMINVIDFYEAVTAKRPYKEPFLPEKAAELLLDGAGIQFNPVCVEAFLGYFGAFPISTRVALDDGTQGRVVANNPDDPFRPCIRITHDENHELLRAGPVVDTRDRNKGGEYNLSIVESLHSEIGVNADAAAS